MKADEIFDFDFNSKTDVIAFSADPLFLDDWSGDIGKSLDVGAEAVGANLYPVFSVGASDFARVIADFGRVSQ